MSKKETVEMPIASTYLPGRDEDLGHICRT